MMPGPSTQLLKLWHQQQGKMVSNNLDWLGMIAFSMQKAEMRQRRFDGLAPVGETLAAAGQTLSHVDRMVRYLVNTSGEQLVIHQRQGRVDQ